LPELMYVTGHLLPRSVVNQPTDMEAA